MQGWELATAYLISMLWWISQKGMGINPLLL